MMTVRRFRSALFGVGAAVALAFTSVGVAYAYPEPNKCATNTYYNNNVWACVGVEGTLVRGRGYRTEPAPQEAKFIQAYITNTKTRADYGRATKALEPGKNPEIVTSIVTLPPGEYVVNVELLLADAEGRPGGVVYGMYFSSSDPVTLS